MAVKTLHRALISPNETSSRFFSNHDVISPHEEAFAEPKAWNVSDISPLSYPVLGMAELWEQGGCPLKFWQIRSTYLKEWEQTMPPTLLLAPTKFSDILPTLKFSRERFFRTFRQDMKKRSGRYF